MTVRQSLSDLSLRALALCLGLLAAGACGGPAETSAADAGGDVATDSGTPPAPDTAAPGAVVCCPQGLCPAGLSCVSGACLPPASRAGACYLDAQCGSGQVCDGEARCGCGEVCEAAPGTCAYPEGCCNADADCDGGTRCVGGQCVAAPTEGGCWQDADCGAGPSSGSAPGSSGRVCEDARVCACGEAGCESAPGHCALPGVCCATDVECGQGGACVAGRCVPEARDGTCWVNGDCGAGETCRGATTCPCTPGAGDEATCALPSTAGRCAADDAACCTRDADCGAGELCVEGRFCAPKPDVAAGACFVDGHCGAGRVCEGARGCDCGEDGCEPVAGTCRTEVIACEVGGAACPAGLKCAVPDRAWCPDEPGAEPDDGPGAAAPTEGVCVPLNDEGCWSSNDCNPNLRCGAEVICSDAGGCAAPNRPGVCDTKVRKWDCCNSHLECGPGLMCRNQNSSESCPPSGSAVCVPIPEPGRTCWNYDDCPDGLACQKVVICGCNGRCFFNRIGQCEAPTFCEADTDCGDFAACARDVECILSPCSSVSTCPFGGTCQDRIEGRCWNHESCATGEYCAGLQICPPDTTCAYPDTPGLCEPRADLGACCSSFKGCKPGLRCVSGGVGSSCSLDTTSVCVPATAVGGACYTDEDCDRSEFCEGEFLCPCGLEGCEGDPRPGRCAPR
jgi:hypothetical protein